jgi:hypothetical protein
VLPFGLIGALGLVVAIEAYVGRHPGFNLLAATWRTTYDAAPRAAAGCRVLALGDSLVKHGVVPRVIEDRLGVRAYNLALPGCRLAGSVAMLKRALGAGQRPDVVLVDGELIASSPLALTRPWLELLDTRELFQLAWATGESRAGGMLLLSRLLPSLRERDEIRMAVLGRSRDDRETLAVYRRNWRRNRGAQVLPAVPPAPVVAPEFKGVGSVYCHPANERAIHDLLELARIHGVTVCWLLTPLHPLHQDFRDRSGWTPSYRDWLKGLQSRYRNLVVIDGQSSGYPEAAMADPTHMNRLGAARFSADLADALGPFLGRRPPRAAERRWVMLPGYRSDMVVADIEELPRSQTAVQGAIARRSAESRLLR